MTTPTPPVPFISDAVTDTTDFPDRGHSPTIDSGWREAADTALTWLRRQGL
ncbi:hypothetical protein ACFYU9_16760 [Streptomyces sp. NPDC004327]|uniref:hypothetical protein n=1 Tax=Streptomyces sp. NPDC004327 TaxID=3364699 RepID=UPI0036C01F78